MIELPHLNPHSRLLLLLLFCDRCLYLLFLRRYLAIEYAEVNTRRLFGQFSRLLHVIQQSNVCAPHHVFDCLRVGRIVHELVESVLVIVMLELLAFFCVVCNVACNIGQRFEADRSVHFNYLHSAIEVEAEQLT